MRDDLSPLGIAYEKLRTAIESWTTALGDSNFARAIVTLGAREALRLARVDRNRDFSMVFCEALTASPAEFEQAQENLTRQFAPRPDSATHVSEALPGFSVVLRGTRLYLETPQATAQLAFAYSDTPERWSIAMDPQGEAFIRHLKRPSPAVKTTHTKSEDGAIKALLRMAHSHFGIELKVV